MERDPNPLCHQLQKPLIAPVEGTGHEHFRSNLSVERRIWPIQAAFLGPNRLGGSAARIFDEPRHYRFSRDRHWPKPVDLSGRNGGFGSNPGAAVVTPSKGRIRRILVVASPSGEGPFTIRFADLGHRAWRPGFVSVHDPRSDKPPEEQVG